MRKRSKRLKITAQNTAKSPTSRFKIIAVVLVLLLLVLVRFFSKKLG